MCHPEIILTQSLLQSMLRHCWWDDGCKDFLPWYHDQLSSLSILRLDVIHLATGRGHHRQAGSCGLLHIHNRWRLLPRIRHGPLLSVVAIIALA